MVSLLGNQYIDFLCLTIFNPKAARLPQAAWARPDQVHDLISRLGDVGEGDGFRSFGMRVEDADHFEGAGLDPLKRLELLIGIHHESHGTLRLVPYKDHPLHPTILPGEQTARFEWHLVLDVTNHFVYLSLGQD